MHSSSLLFKLATLATLVVAQSQTQQQVYTLTGCHRHGDAVHCVRPDGSETPYTTLAPAAQAAETPPPPSGVVTRTAAAASTAVSGCHFHAPRQQVCRAGAQEWRVAGEVQEVGAPAEYGACYAHGETELHCKGDGRSATLMLLEHEEHADAPGEEHAHGGLDAGVSCHSHAGVEHCVDAQERTVEAAGCARPNRDYNIPLRIGLLFVILVTSAIGVFLPMIISRMIHFQADNVVMVVLRQFGTGIIISTALVHLYTHAQLYFGNRCLTGITYEGTVAAIVMAGIFLTAVVEWLTHRFAGGAGHSHIHHGGGVGEKDSDAEQGTASSKREELVSITAIEAGIIFHSILLGVTLVVAADSGFITLFIVVLFHQMFEGIALGTRIAILRVGALHKLLMGSAFAVVTPVGMAIGIGVLSRFNGNDPSTIIAIGTLNAVSAGILLWIGIVDMWYEEWFRGALAGASWGKVAASLVALVAGLVVMSVLGKWA